MQKQVSHTAQPTTSPTFGVYNSHAPLHMVSYQLPGAIALLAVLSPSVPMFN